LFRPSGAIYNQGTPVRDTPPLNEHFASDGEGDGLSNLEEYQNNTNPAVADTDADGLSDGLEVNTHGTDPNNPDTEADGLSDDTEVSSGLDPLYWDSDGDAMPDGFEVAHGASLRGRGVC